MKLVIVLAVLLSGIIPKCSKKNDAQADQLTQNKALSDRIQSELYSKGNLSFADSAFATDVTNHDFMDSAGLAPFKNMVASMRAAFPDMQVTTDATVAENDMVAVHANMTGTHKGDFMGMKASGNTVTASMTEIMKFNNGKVSEQWIDMDSQKLKDQLGNVKAGSKATAHGKKKKRR
jgi:predicted ester cyclase